MSADIIVKQLLEGSRNIDLMKGEVNKLVHMLKGFASISHHCHSCTEKYFSETFKSDNGSCEWSVRGILGSMNKQKNGLKIECLITKDTVRRVAYTDTGNYPFHTDTAQDVYESLPVLVKGVIKTFPGIESHWRPLVEASKVKF